MLRPDSPVEPQTGGRVPLRVGVDEKDAQAAIAKAGAQVYRRRRLADAALLVRDARR